MEPIKALLTETLHHFIHRDFHEVVARMTLIDKFLFLMIHSIDKLGIWPRLPVFLGLIYVVVRRHLHQDYNLINVGRTPVGVRSNPADFPFRTADGKFNDPFKETAGSQGTFFGRNIPPLSALLKPDPIVVATKLLARRTMKDNGKQFNMIAASWLQFMIHDWIDHLEDTNQRDGSAIYRSNAQRLGKVRTFKDGKLKILKDGLLLHDHDGTALFVQEHNAVCDALKKEYRLLGKKFKETFRHVGGAILERLVSLKKSENYGVPYSLTEEFVSVYRIHPLLPDHLLLRNINAAPGPNKSPPLIEKFLCPTNLVGHKGEKALTEIGFTRQMVSKGHQSCGAKLWNYPLWLREIIPQDVDGTDRTTPVDLHALEVYRDRKRKEAIDTLKQLYGDDVKNLDLLVGLMAEKKIKGFAISETAFIIFVIMVSRRLEPDRFFTSNFNEETYTKKGMEWVKKTESLKDAIDRHYSDMTNKWMNSTSAFTVWDAPPNPHNHVPLYLRIPQ
ncbi:unnamed protein product [Camellia sinensis]